jgi:hypothetical protein
MVKVILKHSNKAKALKKKIKEEREKIEVKAEKRVNSFTYTALIFSY